MKVFVCLIHQGCSTKLWLKLQLSEHWLLWDITMTKTVQWKKVPKSCRGANQVFYWRGAWFYAFKMKILQWPFHGENFQKKLSNNQHVMVPNAIRPLLVINRQLFFTVGKCFELRDIMWSCSLIVCVKVVLSQYYQ